MEKLLEALKKLLGDEKITEVKTILDSHKVIIDDGESNIPRSRLNEVLQQKKDAIEALELMKVEVEKLKALDSTNQKLQEKITEAQGKVKELQTNHETELVKMKKKHVVELTLNPLVHDIKATMPYIDMEKISVNDDGVIGLKEQIEKIKTDQKFLLKEEKTPKKLPGDDGLNLYGENGFKNPFDPKNLSITNQSILKKEKPELYLELKAKAEKGIFN